MKKLLYALLCIVIILCLSACIRQGQPDDVISTDENASTRLSADSPVLHS